MLVIREAAASDAPLIVDMIRELAEFEHELDQAGITPDDLLRDGFDSLGATVQNSWLPVSFTGTAFDEFA